MKTYIGERLEEGCEVYVIEDGKRYPLPLHTEILNHSPTGFGWGYGGSGPAQLALAILCDFLGPAPIPARCPLCESAFDNGRCVEKDCGYDFILDYQQRWKLPLQLYQEFKRGIIASLASQWFMDGEAVRMWALEAARGRAAG